MTKKQRVTMWRRMSQCFDRHERTMIEQQKKKSRMDIIGQNGNTGEHIFVQTKVIVVIGGVLRMIGMSLMK